MTKKTKNFSFAKGLAIGIIISSALWLFIIWLIAEITQ